MKYNNLNIADKISISRMAITLPLIYSLSSGKISIAWFLILIGGLTDILDGYIARKANIKSQLGAKLDPLADKVFILAPILWLLRANFIPFWSVWLLLSRELIVSTWRSDLSKVKSASRGGKLKTISLFISIELMLWPTYWFNSKLSLVLNTLGSFIFYISLILAIITAYNYLTKD